VADASRRELRYAEQAAEWIERCCHVHIEVRVDTTRHRARRIYSGHRHPFSFQLVRGGTRRSKCAAPVRSSCSRRAIRRSQSSVRATDTWDAGRRIVLKTG
jgi:hypothetical protein